MFNGFGTQELAQARTIPLVAQCGACQLYRHCQSPKMPVSGKGRRKILILGEAPGKNEDEQGIQFCGESGRLLEKALWKFGVDLRKDCWITNAAICHPPRNEFPPKVVDYCRPNLIRTVEELKPEIIIPLGAKAVQSLLGWVWRREVGVISRWDGWRIPCQKLNAWITPTWHPAYILRTDYGVSQKQNDVRRILFEQHLENAIWAKEKGKKVQRGRPWREIPDYAGRVKVIHDPDRAAAKIEAMTARRDPGPMAFDYECDRLKPDGDGARIVCCSISDGDESVAFPWHGRAIEATREFLRSDIPKVASNAMFEHKWSMKLLGCKPRNWAWCTMIGAHVLDNRPGIAGIEFQAFVNLGVPPWDQGVTEYLKARHPNEENRIRECPLDRLMRYCAFDSLYEILVAKKQAKLLGKTW